jgi:hypothetical protein
MKMKKYYLILIAMVFLLSCESEKDPCDIEYKLNEPGGFGRNEVTFMLGDEIWYSKGSGFGTGGMGGGISGSSGGFSVIRKKVIINGEVQKDENGNVLFYDYYGAGFKTANNIECNENMFYNHTIQIGFSGFSEKIDSISSLYIKMSVFSNHKGDYYLYGMTESSTFNGKVNLDKVNKICYGELEAMLYNIKKIDGKYYLIDSIQLKDCVFDFKYNEIENGEIEQ